jgi:GxxExxY protein
MVERDEQTSAILGAAVEVHRTLGRGFLEAVYQRALSVELDERRIPYVTQAPVAVRYKEQELGCGYRADVICYPDEDPVLLELKALKRFTDVERAQLLHYLRASRIRRGLLLNFGADVLEIQRMVNG